MPRTSSVIFMSLTSTPPDLDSAGSRPRCPSRWGTGRSNPGREARGRAAHTLQEPARAPAFPLRRARPLARANAAEGLGAAGGTGALPAHPRSAARGGGRARGREEGCGSPRPSSTAPSAGRRRYRRRASPWKAAGLTLPMQSLHSERSAKSLASLPLQAGAWVCPRARVGISRLMLSRLGHSWLRGEDWQVQCG